LDFGPATFGGDKKPLGFTATTRTVTLPKHHLTHPIPIPIPIPIPPIPVSTPIPMPILLLLLSSTLLLFAVSLYIKTLSSYLTTKSNPS